MATRRPTKSQTEPSQLDRDAKEFGIGVRCGGWRLGLLVARNVAPAKPGRPAAGNHSPENEKVSMNRFAESAGVSPSHVKYYYDAWEFAAQAGLVPKASQIVFGDQEVDVDIDSIEVEDNPRTQWSHFYSLAKNPPEKLKAKEPQEDSKPDPKVDDSKIDADFGIADSDDEDEADSMSEAQRAEADSAISRNTLIEILESAQALKSRLTRVEAPGSHSEIVAQIRSAASELMELAATMEAAQPQLRAV